jgi:hypothetical protein
MGMTSLTRKCPSLAKRGRGDFMNKLSVFKIPLNPLLQRGEILSYSSKFKYFKR